MRNVLAAIVGVFVVVLAGCSTAHLTGPVSVAQPFSTAVSGRVHGGQQPVAGATVQLWQVGTTGYGSGASALGSSAVSLADGSFSITGNYSCANGANGGNTLVYITATGGNPGGGTNSQLAMMTTLGNCGNLTPSTFISINEVTTVGAVYALAQFMDPTGNIGSFGYSNGGLTNAFATANNLVNSTVGAANAVTPNGNGSVPQAEINTLANIMATCINSASVSGSPSSACSALFAAAQVGTGSTTIGAMRNIALNPGANVAQIFGLSSGFVPFAPTLASVPNDWTMAVAFAGGGISARSVAIDAAGNVWTANYANGPNGTGSVSELSAAGVPANFSPFTSGIFGPYALAFDSTGRAWVVNHDANQIIALGSNGNSVSGPFQYPETSAPNAIAIDGKDNIWVSNSGNNTLTEVNASINTGQSSGGLTGGGLSVPSAIAIDGSGGNNGAVGNAWVANSAGSDISEFKSGGVAISTLAGYTGSGLNSPVSIAFDSGNNAWVANAGAGTLSKFNSSGGSLGGFNGGGLSTGSAVAVDGSGQVFVVNMNTPSLSMFTSSGVALSPSTGFQGGSMGAPDAMAIDASGNVWVGNQAPLTVNGALATVTQFVGLAVPSITPLALAVQIGQIGQKPGTPIPVSIVSGVLPYYSVNVNYADQLVATGGNTGAYRWSITLGALPSGLTLTGSGASAGIIGGTTAISGSSTFTVQACDASNAANCATKAFTLTASNSLPHGGGEAGLNGSYAVKFERFDHPFSNLAAGQVVGEGFLASLSFDGNGNISGKADFNDFNDSGVTGSAAVTGFYTLGTDQRGTMVLIISGRTTPPLEFAFSVGNFNGATAQSLRLVEFDDTNVNIALNNEGTDAGEGKLQNPAAFVPGTLNQQFVFALQGETPCSNENGANPACATTLSVFGPISAAGFFTGNGAGMVTGGGEDGAARQIGFSGITLSGFYTNPDAAGRGTMTLNPVGTTYPAPPNHFVYYLVNSGEMFLMSTDGHLNRTLLVGDVLAQTTVFTTSSTLSGNFVLYGSQAKDTTNGTIYPTVSSTLIALLTSTGTQFNAIADSNNPNRSPQLQLQLGQTFTGLSYTIDANGRMAISNIDSVIYLANGTQGLGTQLPTAGSGSAGLLNFEQQSGGPTEGGTNFTCSNAVNSAGTYFVSDIQSPVIKGLSSGVVVQNGNGTGTLTLDNSDPSGVLTQGQIQSVSCAADTNGITSASTGRFTYTTGGGSVSIGYAISPTKTVIMNVSPGQSTPGEIII